MKTLDRYIIKQFLINYVILAVVMSCLFMMIDLIVDLDEFVEAVDAVADRNDSGKLLATLWVMWDFYLPMLTLLYVFFGGVLAAGAMGFTLSNMIRAGELVAMVTSGLSMYRIAAPMIVAAGLLIAVALPVQELVIPHFAYKLMRSKNDLKREAVESPPVRFMPDSEGNLYSASSYDSRSKTLFDLTVLERDDAGQTTRRVSASQATWDEQRGGWALADGVAIRRSLQAVDRSQQAASSQTSPGAISASVPVSPIDFLPSDLGPDVLMARFGRFFPRFLSLRDLAKLRENQALDPGNRKRLTQIMHGRFSTLVTGLLIVVMGLPFFLLREPASLLMQSTKAAALCLGAWAGALLVGELSLGGIGPVTAAWLAVIVLLPVTVGRLLQVRT